MGSQLDQVTECKMGMMLLTPIIPSLKALKLYLGKPSSARWGTLLQLAHGKKAPFFHQQMMETIVTVDEKHVEQLEQQTNQPHLIQKNMFRNQKF